MTQKSAVLIYFAAEARNHAIARVTCVANVHVTIYDVIITVRVSVILFNVNISYRRFGTTNRSHI